MVEHYAAAGKNIVGFAIVDCHPMRVQFGDGVGTAWVELRRLRLGNCLNQAEHFRGRCLIKTDRPIDRPDRFQQVERADTVNLGRQRRLVKGGADKALRGEIIDLLRLSQFQYPKT